MSYQIEAHTDESVTLTVKHLKVRISGNSFAEANDAAHRLGEAVTLEAELRHLRLAAVSLKDQMVSMAGSIGRLEAYTQDVLSRLAKV